MQIKSNDSLIGLSRRPEGDIQRDLAKLLAFAYESDPSLGNWLWYSPHAMGFLQAIGDGLIAIRATTGVCEWTQKREVAVALKSIAEDLYSRPFLIGYQAQLTPAEQDQVVFKARNLIQLWAGGDSISRRSMPLDMHFLNISRGQLPVNCRGDISLTSLVQPAFVLFLAYLRDIVQKAIPARLY